MSHELEIMRHSKRYRHASVSDRLWKQQLSEQLESERSFQSIIEHTPDPVFGTHANKLRAIDSIVDKSQPGSLNEERGRAMVDDLFSRRAEMTAHEYHVACDLLDTVLANNIEYWYSTDLSKYWSGNPNRA